MAKKARAGELRTVVFFRRLVKGTDSGGSAHQREEAVFPSGPAHGGPGAEGPAQRDLPDGQGGEKGIHCKWVNAHGAEVFAAMQQQIREPATLTLRYSPLIQPSMLVYKRGDPRPWEIISVNNVEDRGVWLELKVQRKGAAR